MGRTAEIVLTLPVWLGLVIFHRMMARSMEVR